MLHSVSQRRIKAALLGGILLFLFWFIPPVWHLKGGYTTVTQWQKQIGAKQVDVGPAKPSWISVNAVSKHILYAFVAAEDAHFFTHGGFDFSALYESAKYNFAKGKYVRGGSTISQQVVKMAFLSRDKTLIRKIREAIGTVMLETLLSKDEILEWYINLAEFGDGVYGLRAAARHYFGTKPELLTIQQATHLALVLPSPNGWSVGLRRRNLTDFGHRRFANIVTAMKLSGYITETQWLNALATGNFGRPVLSYDRIIARIRQRESVASQSGKEELTPESSEQEQAEMESLIGDSANLTEEELKDNDEGEAEESHDTSESPAPEQNLEATP